MSWDPRVVKQTALPGFGPAPYLPPVYDEKTRRLAEVTDAFFAGPGRGKSHALFCQLEAAVNVIQDEGLRARILVYCAFGRIQPVDMPIPDGVTVTSTLDLADAWNDDDGLYTVVRRGAVDAAGKPVTLRSLMGLCEPGIPTLVFVDEAGHACKGLTPRERDELSAVMAAGRGGLPDLGIGPVVIRMAAQLPSQVHPDIRSQVSRQWYGPYPGNDAGAGIPPVAKLPKIDKDPWGSFYSASTGVVLLATDYDKAIIKASHGADWGAKK